MRLSEGDKKGEGPVSGEGWGGSEGVKVIKCMYLGRDRAGGGKG